MTTATPRFFNTAGPIDAEMHYHVSPLARLDVEDLLLLIRQRKYFVLHAPSDLYFFNTRCIHEVPAVMGALVGSAIPYGRGGPRLRWWIESIGTRT